MQRCQLHKRRNVKDHLPQGCRADYDRQLRNAYAMTGYEDAQAAREKIFRQLERINPSAARSLEEGRDETLTLHRLGVGPLLRRSLSTTNTIESCLSTVRQVAGNVKRGQGGDHIARWTAAGLLEAEKKFRKVKGYRELGALHRRLNPDCSCGSCQEHRQNEPGLHSRAQVAYSAARREPPVSTKPGTCSRLCLKVYADCIIPVRCNKVEFPAWLIRGMNSSYAREGLAESSQSLSSEEENLLRSAVSEIAENPSFTPGLLGLIVKSGLVQ